MRNLQVLLGLGLALILSGCSAGGGSAASGSHKLAALHINLSGGSVGHSKMTAMDAPTVFPTNRKRCYAVNITAPDIDFTAPSCGPAVGILSGFYASGTDEITLNAPVGTDRKLEVYMLLMAVGDDSDCPAIGTSLDRGQLNNMYRIGELDGVTIQDAAPVADDQPASQDVSTPNVISILPVYQGAAENVVAQMGLDPACMTSVAPSAFDNFTILDQSNWIALNSSMLPTSFDDNGMRVQGDAGMLQQQWQTMQANYSVEGDFTNSATFTLNRVDNQGQAGVRMVLRFQDNTFIHFTCQIHDGSIRFWRAVYKDYDPGMNPNPVVDADLGAVEDWSDWTAVDPGSKVQLVVTKFGSSYSFGYKINGVAGQAFGTFPVSIDLTPYAIDGNVTPMLTTFNGSTDDTIDVSYSGWSVLGLINDTLLDTIPSYFQPF